MELISVIIPIYNTQRYLDKCIRSVLDQTYRNIEVLLINDGSTDASGEICERYALEDSRIVYIHTINQGRVKARKLGMERCTGDIITFVDSDDWLEPNAYEEMYNSMLSSGADIVIFGYFESGRDYDKPIYNTLEAGIYEGVQLEQEFFTQMLYAKDFFVFGIQPFLWNKLYRRKYIEPYIMRLDERLVVGEDVVCLYPALLSATRIRIVDEACYHYVQHSDSTMKSLKGCDNEEKEIQNIKIQHTDLMDFCRDSLHYTSVVSQIERYIIHHLIVRGFSCVSCMEGQKSGFPFMPMERGTRVVIYGAGGFGVAVYRYYNESSKYTVVGWTDSSWEKYQSMNYPIQTWEEIRKCPFDYVILAVMSEDAAKVIGGSLARQGVNREKIVWLDDKLYVSGSAGALLSNLEDQITNGRML